ncbi:multidrug effflux MFS transporter [Thioclava sp. GXIMD4216]|uniref:Bcr/CflA family efflux transporter n=1 Tax=Thioclava litoralis TaxID=3076557 RepID=A0ABZ1DYI4_9RHOB|nr:multidrug effflux MFS transporter [Thioclava sp. FTW29]
MTHMDHSLEQTARTLSLREFTVMLASLIATVAFSIDAMLPALSDIAAALTPEDVNKAQLILTSFVFGMGAGTFFVGPISDAIGRRVTIALGIVIYMTGAIIAISANSLEALLVARFIQGFGASSPRLVPMALVRDLYRGREMAQVTSIIMMIFIIVPALAPSIGAAIIAFSDWRGIFYVFCLFGTIGVTWLFLRQPETLPPERRRPLRLGALVAGASEVLRDRQVCLYIVIMTLGFSQMFAAVSSAEQLYKAYGVTDHFPRWFALGALMAGSFSFLNSRLVVRLGMRRIVSVAYRTQVVISLVMLALQIAGMPQSGWGFAVFFLYFTSVFAMAGVTFGNLNALAMQNVGHLAGMAASVITALSTVGSVMIAAPIGLAFNGTVLPLVIATFVCSGLAMLLMTRTQGEG